MSANRHRWSEGDELVALYLQRHECARLPYTVSEIARRMGVEDGTLRMRIGNFKALDGPGGLRNWAKQSERVYLENRYLDEPRLRERVLAYLAPRS